MRIKKNIINFLEKELSTQTIDDVWMKILKTHIQQYSQTHNKEDFSTHKDFNKYETYSTDILESLSLVEISMIYEFSLATVDKHNRKQTGSYYTPEDIADFMAKKSEFFEKGKVWLDPCSGIGNLSYHLAKVQEDSENFVLNNLILQDINSLALKISHVLFALYFQNTIENYYDKIAKNFIVKDFLKDYKAPVRKTKNSNKYENDLFEMFSDNEKYDSEIEKCDNNSYYDYVIVNPPYLSKTNNKDFLSFECNDLYGYFLEKIIFNSEGFISITPQSFTNGIKFQTLRNIVIDEMDEISIYSCDNMPDSVFRSYKYDSSNTNTKNSVRASVVVAKKNDKNKNNHKITSLMRWTSSQRIEAIRNFDNQLVNTIFEQEEIFPKLYPGTEKFYSEIKNKKPIKSLLSKSETDYCLIVPSTPRYYISASKTDLSRSSFHKLFFNNEADMNLSYVLINSSYMYWWWRIVSDGMSLSKDNLVSLPLIENLNVDDNEIVSLIDKLENSEKINKVVKMNAGKANENIKHPFDLIDSLNKKILSDNELIENIVKSHKNSIVS